MTGCSNPKMYSVSDDISSHKIPLFWRLSTHLESLVYMSPLIMRVRELIDEEQNKKSPVSHPQRSSEHRSKRLLKVSIHWMGDLVNVRPSWWIHHKSWRWMCLARLSVWEFNIC